MEAAGLKKDKIYNKLKQAIINAELIPGKKLPRETDLAKALKVGRITLRSSLDRLEHEGYIKRVHGKGTFVSPEHSKISANSSIMVVSGNEQGFESPHNYIVPEVVRFAGNHNCETLVTTDTAMLMFSDSEIQKYVRKHNVIGIIAVMNGFNGNEPIIEKFRSAEVPVIITHCSEKDVEVTGFYGISVDEKEGWEAAVAYLCKCGHRNIGMLGLANERFRGFSKAECVDLLGKYGAEADGSWIVGVEFDREKIKRAVHGMFSAKDKPTAILCYSDFCAIYVYEALKEMNLDIPGDVAVMGTCGYPDARLLSPPLSTVDYEYSRFADMAVEMLQESEKWFSEEKSKLREKAFKIRKRQSTSIKLTK